MSDYGKQLSDAYKTLDYNVCCGGNARIQVDRSERQAWDFECSKRPH